MGNAVVACCCDSEGSLAIHRVDQLDYDVGRLTVFEVHLMTEEFARPFLRISLTAHSMHAVLVDSSPYNIRIGCQLEAGLGLIDGRANA